MRHVTPVTPPIVAPRFLLASPALALAGTAYLLASARVANTYPRAETPEVLAEVFD